MAEKQILFSGEMVRAILAGEKTQTRRVVKFPAHYIDTPHDWDGSDAYIDGGGNWVWWSGGTDARLAELTKKLYSTGQGVPCPYGKPGDYLWVRETWQAQNINGKWWHEVPKAERELHNWSIIDKATIDSDLPAPPKWIPSIFMPRWASRITLRVEDVRVERLQDITEADAKAEGVESNWSEGTEIPAGCEDEYIHYSRGEDDFPAFSAKESFESLWDSINAKRGYSWDSNPWVWVVEFSKEATM